jgi:hypothetical protein
MANEPTVFPETVPGTDATIMYGAKAMLALPSGNTVWFPPFIGAVYCHCCNTRERALVDARGPGYRSTETRFFLCATCAQELIVELARGYAEFSKHEAEIEAAHAHANPG